MALAPEADELFRVPPSGFIAARNALVARLREEDRNEEAAAVQSLRKPTAVVWALNQLASRDPDALASLFEAGRDLRAAQQAAVAGKASGAEDLRTATDARRAAVARARDSAISTLQEAGLGAGQADAIATALETASTDAEAGAALAAGTLQQAPAAAAGLGFGEVPGMTVLPGGATGTDHEPRPARDAARLRKERDKARAAAAGRRATADRLDRQLADAREHVERLERDHAAAESAALAAEAEAERVERDLGR